MINDVMFNISFMISHQLQNNSSDELLYML